MRHRLLTLVLVGLLPGAWGVALEVEAQTSTPADPTIPDRSRPEVIRKQEELKNQFQEFSSALRRLAIRLERSSKPEDQQRAKVLRKAIDLAEKEGVDNQFTKLITILTRSETVTISELQDAVAQNQQLTNNLRELLAILLSDDEAARIRAEIERTQRLLKQLKALIRVTKIQRAITESGRGQNQRVAEDQNKIAKKTEDLSKQMGNAPAKPSKGSAKGQGKGRKGKQGTSKDDTKEVKAAAKSDAKPADGKQNPGDSKGKQDNAGKPTSGSKGSGQPSQGGGKPGQSKSKGQPQPPMPMGENRMKKKTQQPADRKARGDGKSQSKGGKGQGQAGKGKGKQSQGQSGQQGQQAQSKGDGQPGQPGQQSQQGQQPNQTPGREKVRDAIPDQRGAAEDIREEDRQAASKKQDEAIEKLIQAQQELEDRLKQLREEELERLLANLENRISTMLALQIEVYQGTKQLDRVVQQNPDQKPTRGNTQKSQDLSDTEAQIINQADQAIQLLESEGSAVAFPQVLEEVKQDMLAVQRRLDRVIVNEDTQAIEQDIIASLKQMLEALKKARQELKNPNKPSPPSSGGQQPPDQKLIDLLAELKMIRSLQQQVNNRTKRYGKKYEGEQAGDPIIRNELQQIASRQERILKMTQDIAFQRNQ